MMCSILLNTNGIVYVGGIAIVSNGFIRLISHIHTLLLLLIYLPQQPHGRAFKILSKEKLISDVLPNYYVCKKYGSFSRQLNGWGFKRLHQSGPGTYPRGLHNKYDMSKNVSHYMLLT